MQMALRINLPVAELYTCNHQCKNPSTVSWRVHSSNEHSYIELYYYKALQSNTILYDVVAN